MVLSLKLQNIRTRSTSTDTTGNGMLAVIRFFKAMLLSGCIAIAGCACVPSSIDEELDKILADVGNQYAADTRISVWDELNNRLHAKKMPVSVRVAVLPQDNVEIGDRAWALVNVSVATIKKEPRFAVAATTQALAGTPLRLLEFKTPFWRVQMPDGYIGWVHRLQIARMSAKVIQVFFELLMSGKQTRISPFVTDCEGKNLGLSLGSCLAPLSNFSEHRTFGEE